MSGSSLDPRTPVIIGSGQWSNRVDRGEAPVEPVELLAEAVRRSAADTGVAQPSTLLEKIDSMRIPRILSWHYRDPGRLVAGRVGARTLRQSVYTDDGGNNPLALINSACRDIAAGSLDLVVVGGAEAWRTRMEAKAVGRHLDWTKQAKDSPRAETFGVEWGMDEMLHPIDVARNVVSPIQVYPVFESALRAEAGASHEVWTRRLGNLWCRFSEVAAGNPHAWIQRRQSPEEITTPSATNRMIGFPYTKAMNSNNAVEQSAAILLCSLGFAEQAGVPRERWVFPLAGTDGNDTRVVLARRDLRSSPAMAIAGRRVMELAGIGADEVAFVDLYSCFPAAVQIGATSLGFGLDRPLTVTGGLSFAGGPWNNYVSHSVATMSDVLREHPGDIGLVSANGGYVTKHSFGLFSTEPPAGGFKWVKPQDDIDASFTPTPVAEANYSGPVTIEAYTVMHDRDGSPDTAIAAVRTPDGERTWATSCSETVMSAFTGSDAIGGAGRLGADGTLSYG